MTAFEWFAAYDPWYLRWRRYGTCPYCHAADSQPCEDQRWDGKHPRWCRQPHPERKHAKKGMSRA